MRVKLEHREIKEGLVFRSTFHEVHLTVDFTHEEKQIIRQRGLLDEVILDRQPAGARPTDNPDWYLLRIGHLIVRKPDRFRLANPSAAKQYAARLSEALQYLKVFLEENADPAATEVFEI